MLISIVLTMSLEYPSLELCDMPQHIFQFDMKPFHCGTGWKINIKATTSPWCD